MNDVTRQDLAELDYGISMAIGGLIEAMGMHAENQHRLSMDQSIAYDSEAFAKLNDERGLHPNDILTRWYPRPPNA